MASIENCEIDVLFVYGTLRSESSHPMAQWLAAHARNLGAATMKGRLYAVGDYPGAVDAEDELDMIRGDLYHLRKASEILSVLDAYEECSYEQNSEYQRALREIRLGEKSITAWVYLYLPSCENLPLIPGGDYLEELQRLKIACFF